MKMKKRNCPYIREFIPLHFRVRDCNVLLDAVKHY